MRKSIALILTMACVLGLVGCGQSKQIPPETDQNASFRECWSGTITKIFTEGGGQDVAEVIELERKDLTPMYFTIVENTEYLRYDSDTETTEKITKEDLDVGAWVEIDCESSDYSEYYPILTIKVIEPAKKDVQSGGIFAADAFDIAVSYANWTEGDRIYVGSLNRGKMAISSVRHLPIYRLDTLEDLQQFKRTFEDVLTMDSGYDEVPSFQETVEKYDDSFFEDNSLMLVYIGTSSGTYRFGVHSVFCDENSFCIHVEQINHPEDVTQDMAGWFVTVAVPDTMIANCTEFDADQIFDVE